MERAKKSSSTSSKVPNQRSKTPEGRENQLIALAIDLAEEQLRNGTASSQVITHYLKLGSTKERLEKEILMEQKKLIKAKTETLESEKRSEELYTKALGAFRKYSGIRDQEELGEPEEDV